MQSAAPLLGLAAVALALSALVTPVVIRLCRRYNVLDRPNTRKVHAREVPRLGGIALFTALTIGLVLAWLGAQAGLFSLTAAQLRLLPVIYFGLCGFFLIGFADDLRSLPALPRLAAQLCVALAVVLLSGGVIRINSLFGQVLLPPWLAVALTVLWIAGIVNTFNWIDGLDGLSAGIGSISTLAFLLLALLKPGLPNAALTVVLALLLAGALAGFLIYNFHPAKIFIGDGGAFSLGYMLAVISVVGLYKQAAVITFLLPLLILALPIGDTLFAVIRRLWRRQPITRPDNRHIHHRILALMSREYRARLSNSMRDALSEDLQVNPAHRNTVLALYTFAAVFASIAVIVGIRA
jgi:UDP-GlcNAc:undecaprenyl-phosphate GlcNAc-1-phosphate transferase